MAATALLPAVGLLAYNEFSSRQQRSAEVHVQAAQAARVAASEVERIIEGTRSILIALSAIPAIADQDPVGCTTALKRLEPSLTSVGSILVIGPDGKLVCDSRETDSRVDFNDRTYVKDGLAGKDLAIGEYTISKITKNAVLPISMPLREGGKVTGVIATGIRLDWLQARIMERGLVPGGAITIADRNGVILARNPYPEQFVGTRIPDSYQFLVNAAAPGTIDVTSRDGTERILGYQPVSAENPLYVSAGLSKDEAFATVNRVSLTGIAMLILSASFAIIAANLVGNRFILKPLNQIVNVLERWQEGDHTARTHMRGGAGELTMVGRSVDNLLDELERRRISVEVTEEKRNLLVRELSHRLKNTLSIVQSLARQAFRSQTEAFQAFSKRIGALSGAYDLLYSDNLQSSDLHAIIHKTLLPYELESKNRFRIDGTPLIVGPEVALAFSLIIHELATNALKYGALRDDTGSIHMFWEITNGTMQFHWHEHDGPPVVSPSKEGFGSKLIRNAFPADRKPTVDISYHDDGLRFHLAFDISDHGRQTILASG